VSLGIKFRTSDDGALGDRGDCFVGQWHWHHEHHAGDGERAHARIGIAKRWRHQSRNSPQFLSEAVLISLSGGVIGTIIGLAIPYSVHFFTPYKIPISGLSHHRYVVCSLVGILFGTLPRFVPRNWIPSKACATSNRQGGNRSHLLQQESIFSKNQWSNKWERRQMRAEVDAHPNARPAGTPATPFLHRSKTSSTGIESWGSDCLGFASRSWDPRHYRTRTARGVARGSAEWRHGFLRLRRLAVRIIRRRRHVSYGSARNSASGALSKALRFGLRFVTVCWCAMMLCGPLAVALTDSGIAFRSRTPSGNNIQSRTCLSATHIFCCRCQLAEVLGAGQVYIGAVSRDSSGYPDCRPEYYRAVNEVVKRAQKKEHPSGHAVDCHAQTRDVSWP